MNGLQVENETIDLHCHGGAGYYFSDPNPENVHSAIQFHKSHGSNQLLASLVTEDVSVLKKQIRALVPFCEEKSLLGIHLEGPYLAKARCGAHNPALLKNPSVDEIKSLVEASEGNIAMVTIAPELDGALDSIRYLRSQNIIAAIGHSAGGYDDALKAIDAGAQIVTHFSNGMSKLADGERTFATALLYESQLFLEVIIDRHHLSDSDTQTIYAHARNRLVFVTDAMSASGQPDGEYRIGSLEVRVQDGVARLASNGSLAGSTLTMDAAIAHAVSLGFDPETISKATSENPRSLLRL